MEKRTFIRTMLDFFLGNTFVKTIVSFVNFCYEQTYYSHKELKFFKNLPIERVAKEENYSSKLLFANSVQTKAGLK